MSLTLSQMATRVLRNIQVPEDSSASSVQALADAKNYINERARDVWKRRLWREYVILGTYSVPVSTKRIQLSSITAASGFTTSEKGFNASFFEVVAVREGGNPILPEDAGAIQNVDPDIWDDTTTPARFVQLGQRGIYLLGEFSTATTLSFFGKAGFQDLTDAETWILDNENCLIAGATGDMLRDHERDNNRATLRYQEYEGEIAKLVDAQEAQSGNIKRIVPLRPWTAGSPVMNFDTSKIGFDS